MCLVQRLYLKGGKYGCFAAVFSRRKVPALDVTACEPHLFSWASVSCFRWSDVGCPVSHDSTRPSVFVFVCSAYRSTFFFSRSFVLAKAVHLNTTHRVADTVRFRGRGHMVDRVASKGSSQGGAVVLCASGQPTCPP